MDQGWRGRETLPPVPTDEYVPQLILLDAEEKTDVTAPNILHLRSMLTSFNRFFVASWRGLPFFALSDHRCF